MTERQVVEAAGRDLLGRDDDLVAVGPARDRDRAVDHPDAPRDGRRRGLVGEALERAARRALGREDAAVDQRIDGPQVDPRMVRVEDGDHVVVRPDAGHLGQVVGPIDRRPVVDVVGARDDDRPDARVGQPLELRRDPLHGAARLDVRVEQVAGDQEEVDLLRQREVDRRLEGRELPLPLCGRLLTEIVVSRAQMDVRGVDDPEHRAAAVLPGGHARTTGSPSRRWCERGAPMTPRSPTPISMAIVTGTLSRSPPRSVGGGPGERPAPARFRKPLYPPGH